MLYENGKRSVILANTVCLAKQHAENLKLTFPYRIAIFTGEDNVDVWRKEKWVQQFEENQVSNSHINIDFYVLCFISFLLRSL